MINQIFEKLAENSSRNFKIDFLKQHKENELLKRVVKLATDPSINFFIRKIPTYNSSTEISIPLSKAADQLYYIINRVVTGNTAIEHLKTILESCDNNDAKVIERIIKKDLRCGVSASTVNKVWPGLIPEYPYMRCCLPKHTKMGRFDWKGGVLVQEKCDGMFVNINTPGKGEDIVMLSRSGSVLPVEQFTYVINAAEILLNRNTQTHGEILVERDGVVLPREIGNGILNSVLKGGSFEENEVPIIVVWDQIPLTAALPGNKYKAPYSDRLENLNKQIPEESSGIFTVISTTTVHSYEEILPIYSQMLSLGKEGVVVKDRNSVWEDTTSKYCVKYKLEIDVDLLVIGFTEGKGKNADTFGSVICATSDGLLLVNVSGFKDKKQSGILTRQEVWERREGLKGTILTVRSNCIMLPTKSNPSYSLFLPRAVEWRSDKKKADTLQQVVDQFESAVKPVV